MFSANRVISIIESDIRNNLIAGQAVQVENYFGLSNDELNRRFMQPSCIIIIYNGCRYELETNRSMRGYIELEFVVTEQTIATAKDKSDFLLDKFRDYITWQKFDMLQTEYPDCDFEPFIPEEELLLGTTAAGISVFSFRGYVAFVKGNIGG